MQTTPDSGEKALLRLYEVAYLVSPHVPEEKLGETVTRIKGVFDKLGLFISFEEFPKFRKLAYSLVKPLGGKNEKYTNAFFGWVRFEAPAEAVSTLQESFEKDPDVVRFLIVKIDKDHATTTRAPLWRRDTPKREVQKVGGEKAPSMTEAEMDKTIEELVVE